MPAIMSREQWNHTGHISPDPNYYNRYDHRQAASVPSNPSLAADSSHSPPVSFHHRYDYVTQFGPNSRHLPHSNNPYWNHGDAWNPSACYGRYSYTDENYRLAPAAFDQPNYSGSSHPFQLNRSNPSGSSDPYRLDSKITDKTDNDETPAVQTQRCDQVKGNVVTHQDDENLLHKQEFDKSDNPADDLPRRVLLFSPSQNTKSVERKLPDQIESSNAQVNERRNSVRAEYRQNISASHSSIDPSRVNTTFGTDQVAAYSLNPSMPEGVYHPPPLTHKTYPPYSISKDPKLRRKQDASFAQAENEMNKYSTHTSIDGVNSKDPFFNSNTANSVGKMSHYEKDWNIYSPYNHGFQRNETESALKWIGRNDSYRKPLVDITNNSTNQFRNEGLLSQETRDHTSGSDLPSSFASKLTSEKHKSTDDPQGSAHHNAHQKTSSPLNPSMQRSAVRYCTPIVTGSERCRFGPGIDTFDVGRASTYQPFHRYEQDPESHLRHYHRPYPSMHDNATDVAKPMSSSGFETTSPHYIHGFESSPIMHPNPYGIEHHPYHMSPHGPVIESTVGYRQSAGYSNYWDHYYYPQVYGYDNGYIHSPLNTEENPNVKRRKYDNAPKEKGTKITSASTKPARKKKMYSDYIGVTYNKTHAKYQACITHYRKQHYLGRFKLAADAAKSYDESAKELKGNGWKINFQSEDEYLCARESELTTYEMNNNQHIFSTQPGASMPKEGSQNVFDEGTTAPHEPHETSDNCDSNNQQTASQQNIQIKLSGSDRPDDKANYSALTCWYKATTPSESPAWNLQIMTPMNIKTKPEGNPQFSDTEPKQHPPMCSYDVSSGVCDNSSGSSLPLSTDKVGSNMEGNMNNHKISRTDIVKEYPEEECPIREKNDSD